MPLIAKPIRTRYWRPGDNFLGIIIGAVADSCDDGDIIVVSEKAISVAMGRVVDESKVAPSFMAKFLVRVWTRLLWGYFLGPLCHLNRKTLWRLRQYPIPEGEAHKEIALRYAGFSQSLLHYSEGGIDVTNLPYALAAVPLSDSQEVGRKVLRAIKEACGRDVSVMITDTDKTCSRKGIHITARPRAFGGIKTLGLAAFIVGRVLGWTARATPLAVCDGAFSAEEALTVADVADRARGYGAGRTVWDMARKFRVGLTEVTWDMLDEVRHYPIVIVRKIR